MAPKASGGTLVVGGAGFIGSNLVHRLHARGEAVTVADNLFTGSRANLPPGVAFQEMDAASRDYARAFDGRGFRQIVHFGGGSSLGQFDAAHPTLVADSLQAFQNTLELAAASGARVGFASTSSFYARCPKPYREDMAVEAGTHYEFVKLAMEHLARTYWHERQVPSVGFRFFSVYGPRERAKGRYANVVSQFLWCLRADVPPVLYGDGSQTRDFTYVDDLLDALELALGRAKGCDVYNIGTGVEHSFNEVVALLNAALGTKVAPRHVPNPLKNYVQETLADNSKLRALGWAPKVSLEEGIRRLAALNEPVERSRVMELVR